MTTWIAMAWMVGSAQAGLVPDYTPGTERSWKVEAHFQDEQLAISAQHVGAKNESWGGKMNCVTGEKRVETCKLDGGKLYFRWTDPSDAIREFEVEAPLVWEIKYSKEGRIASWGVEGDDMAFYESISKAYASRVSGKQWPMDQANFQRQIGQELTQLVSLWLFAALDAELPRGGDGSQPWKARYLPFATRRGAQTNGSGQYDLQVINKMEDGQLVDLKGNSTYQLNVSGRERLKLVKTDSQNFYTNTIGRFLVGDDGRILASQMWSITGSQLPLIGFKAYCFQATAWTEGMDPKPGPVPPVPGA